jgi:hypothetical protein
VLREIGAVAQATGAGALFLIDEMHNLDAPSLAAICIAFRAISRHGLPVAMVAAGLTDLQVRLMSAKPYADHLFAYHELGRLSDPATRAALIAPAETSGADYQQDPARRVVREAAGSVHRDSLIQKGLIYSPRRGQLDYTVAIRGSRHLDSADDEDRPFPLDRPRPGAPRRTPARARRRRTGDP